MQRVFGCDLRALALLRVNLAILILVDLTLRARDLTAHYTDDGVLPRAALLATDGSLPSLHFAGGSTALQAIWFGIAAAAAIALLIGYRTRLATFVSWLLLISLQARNSALSQGGDVLLRLLLLWGMFLPLGARFSVDRALSQNTAGPDRFFSAATVALLLQCMFVYFFSALLKSDPAWTSNGTAVYLTMQLDHLTTPVGRWLGNQLELTQALTYFVWYLELIGPFLIFAPVLFLWFRLSMMTLFIAMHVGFALCLNIGLFPFVSVASLLAFTPTEVWDAVHRRLLSRSAPRIFVYYDGGCDFCHKICRLLRVFLILPQMEMAPAQDAEDTRALMERHDSWIVRGGGEEHLRWNALVWLVGQSPLFHPLAALLGWLGRRGDLVYGLVARSRSRFSDFSRLALPWGNAAPRGSWLGGSLVVFLLAVVVAGNIKRLDVNVPEPAGIDRLRSILQLSQNWNMFAPVPLKSDTWVVAVATLEDGRQVDPRLPLLSPPAWSKPEMTVRAYPNYRWRKYLTSSIARAPGNTRQTLYAHFLCREWYARHGGALPIRRLELIRVRERTVLDGPSTMRRTLLWQGQCPKTPGSPAPDTKDERAGHGV